MLREGTEGTLPVPVCFCLCFCWDGEYKMRRAVLFGLFLVFQLGRSVETIVINLGAENINCQSSKSIPPRHQPQLLQSSSSFSLGRASVSPHPFPTLLLTLLALVRKLLALLLSPFPRLPPPTPAPLSVTQVLDQVQDLDDGGMAG